MKVKVKIKALDYNTKENKQAIVEIIKEVEKKYPHLELVHTLGLQKNELKLYNVDEEKYLSPIDEEDFINELSSKLLPLDYMAFPYRDKIIIDPAHSRKVETRQKPEDVDIEDIELEDVDQEEDTRYRAGAVTERKLQIFIQRYGGYLRDNTAELNYNRNRDKWGPRFGYKRDEDGAPSDAMREEIKEYINDVFYQ
jgi:hypothetical protein